MKRLVLLLAFLCSTAQAQSPSCMPYVTTPGWVVSDPQMGVSKNGAWIRWKCWSTTGQPDRIVSYVGTVPEFAKVGGRIATIVKAEPLVAATEPTAIHLKLDELNAAPARPPSPPPAATTGDEQKCAGQPGWHRCPWPPSDWFAKPAQTWRHAPPHWPHAPAAD